MGHENIASSRKAGKDLQKGKGLKEGEPRVRYGTMSACNELRTVATTGRLTGLCMDDGTGAREPRGPAASATAMTRAPHLWGGFAQIHVPSLELGHPTRFRRSVGGTGGVVHPLWPTASRWALNRLAGWAYKTPGFRAGPGQQGLSQVSQPPRGRGLALIHHRHSKDAYRLEVAKEDSAPDYTINVSRRRTRRSRIAEITAAKASDVALDCTPGAVARRRFCWVSMALKRKAARFWCKQEPVGVLPEASPLAKGSATSTSA